LNLRASLLVALFGLVASPALAGCPKSTTDAATDAAAPPPAASTAAQDAAGAGDASATAARPAGAATSWSVSYTVTTAPLYIPEHKDWSGTKQFKSDESKHVGEGKLSLTVDPTGRVSGTSEGGPLGNAILDGSVEGSAVHATVRRKDPTDDGLTGTLIGTLSGDKLEGTMKLAEANAAFVREAKLTGARGK
jgi:hypothetical protein